MELFSQLRLSDARSIKLNDHESFSTFYGILGSLREPAQLRVPETIVWGWGIKAPSLLFTNDEGYVHIVENINSEHLQNFLTVCRRHQQKFVFSTPVCIARTEQGTSLVYDTKIAMCLWHRNQIEGTPIMLQRYLISDLNYSKVTRVHWTHLKTQKTVLESRFIMTDESQQLKPSIVRLRTNALTIATSLKKIPKQVLACDDPRFIVKLTNAKKTYDESKIPEIDSQLHVLFNILKPYEKKLEATLLELVANFVRGLDEQWYFINPEYLMFSKHSQLQLSKKRLRIGSSIPSRYRERLSKSKTAEGSRRPVRKATKKLTIAPCAPEVKRSKMTAPSPSSSSTFKGDTPCNRTRLKEMPPLFSFPTPRHRPATTSETFLTVPKDMGFSDYSMSSALPLMSYSYHERLQKIRDFIANQNNSLYARIHYCDEHPSTKQHRDAIDRSMSKIAATCDRVRVQAKLLAKSFTCETGGDRLQDCSIYLSKV
jgi:hypothetical protein